MNARWDSLDSWHHDWSGLRVAVLGLDASGFAVADTLAELGAEVLVLSSGTHSDDRAELLAVIGAHLDVVPSPERVVEALAAFTPEVIVGVPSEHDPSIDWARASGIPVVSELELAWRLRDKTGPAAPWLLVTGSDGAGVTAHLAETMLLAAGVRAMACGGTSAAVPILDVLRVPEGWECVVVAASDLDLRHSTSIAALAAACLDSGADASDLARAYEGVQVACVYNRADAATMLMVEEAEVEEGCRAIGFGLGVPGPSDFGVVEGILCDRAFLDDRRTSALEFGTIDTLAGAGLASREGVERVLAAAALARAYGVPIGALHDALRGLAGAAS